MASNISAAMESTVDNCQICRILGIEESKAEYRCIECSTFMCEMCKIKHAKDPILASHDVKRHIVELNAMVFCNEHPSITALYWCDTCNTPICTACVLTKHNDHKKDNIKMFLTNLTFDMNRVDKKVTKSTGTVQSNSNIFHGKIERIDSWYCQTRDAIEDHYTTTVNALLAEKGELTSGIQKKYDREIDDLKAEVEQEDKKLKDLQDWKVKMTQARKTTNDAMDFNNLINLTKQGDRFADSCIRQEAAAILYPEFVPNNIQLGQLKEREQAAGGSACKGAEAWNVEDDDDQTGSSSNEFQDEVAECATNVAEIKIMKKRGKHVARKCAQHQANIADEEASVKQIEEKLLWKEMISGNVLDITFLSGFQMALLRSNAVTFYELTDDQTSFRLQKDVNLGSHRFSRMAFNNGILYLTCGKDACKKIHEYDMEKQRFVEGKRWRKTFKNPHSIAITNLNTIVVADLGENPKQVALYNQEGLRLYRFGELEKDAVVFQNPDHICCHSDIIYVSDIVTNIVYVFDIFGTRTGILSKPQKAVGVVQMKKPGGMCCDEKGNVLVADLKNKRIILTNHSEKSVRPLLTSGVEQPQFIDLQVSGGRRLLTVLDTYGKVPHVKVFEL